MSEVVTGTPRAASADPVCQITRAGLSGATSRAKRACIAGAVWPVSRQHDESHRGRFGCALARRRSSRCGNAASFRWCRCRRPIPSRSRRRSTVRSHAGCRASAAAARRPSRCRPGRGIAAADAAPAPFATGAATPTRAAQHAASDEHRRPRRVGTAVSVRRGRLVMWSSTLRLVTRSPFAWIAAACGRFAPSIPVHQRGERRHRADAADADRELHRQPRVELDEREVRRERQEDAEAEHVQRLPPAGDQRPAQDVAESVPAGGRSARRDTPSRGSA